MIDYKVVAEDSNMIIYKIRRFQTGDAEEASALISKTLRTVNIKDYSEE